MAQVNLIWQETGRTMIGVNGNGTTAITAGDILYASGSTVAAFGTTAPGAYDYDDIEVEPVKFATAIAQGASVVGIAMEDAAAGSQVTFYTEGVFFSPIIATTCPLRAGAPVRAAQGETTPGVVRSGTTTRTVADLKLHLGVALTGSAVSGDYILWKFNAASRL